MPLAPHTAGNVVDVTRRLVTESPGVEANVIEDLARGLGVETDRVGLAGSGSSGEPTGLLADAAVNVYALGTNGAALGYADCVELERLVGVANADAAAGARLGWATTPNGRAKLRQTEVTTGTGRFVWKASDTILGRPAVATSNLPADLTKGTGTALSALIYGNFADLVIALWGAWTSS